MVSLNKKFNFMLDLVALLDGLSIDYNIFSNENFLTGPGSSVVEHPLSNPGRAIPKALK